MSVGGEAFITFPEFQNAEWRDDARCDSSMTELFFSEQKDDLAAAKAFCQECPVREEYLEYAINAREARGVWGGELINNGKIMST